MRSKKIAVAALAAGFFAMSLTSVSAAFFSGMITVTRDASRQISGAVLQTNNRDGAGNPVTYALVMDENGKAIAEQYENKDIKIEGTLVGKEIKADTWESVPDSASGSSSGSSGSGYSGDSGDSDDSDDSDKPNDSGDSDKPDDSGDSDKPDDSDDSGDSGDSDSGGSDDSGDSGDSDSGSDNSDAESSASDSSSDDSSSED